MNCFTRNSGTDNAVFAGELSWWSSKDPIVCHFHSNSHHSLSQTVQDFKIIFAIHFDTRRYKFFMNYSARIEKKRWPLSWFLFAHASFLLTWRLWRVSCLTLPLGFTAIFGKPTFVTCYDPIKKIWFSFEPFKNFCRHFVSTRFLIVILFFFNHPCTHAFLTFKSCVIIWWTVHSLILI
jgi:hypothetical protein